MREQKGSTAPGQAPEPQQRLRLTQYAKAAG